MSMRLPTLTQFKNEAAQMAKQAERVSTLQTQITTGKKLERASDDPQLALRIQAVTDCMEHLKSYDLNSIVAQNRLALTSTSLQESVDLSSTAQALLMRGQNDTLNDADRQNIAHELKGVLNGLLGIANTQDSNGDYIFSGARISTKAYAQKNGEYTYQGGYEGNLIAIGPKHHVLFNLSGFGVFGDIPSENGTPQNLFQTLQKTIDLLMTPLTSDTVRHDVKQQLTEQASCLSKAANHLILQLTDTGERAKAIDDEITLNKNRIIDQQLMLGRLSDADMTQSISELTQQLTTLNITQQSYLKIQETFLQLLKQ